MKRILVSCVIVVVVAGATAGLSPGSRPAGSRSATAPNATCAKSKGTLYYMQFDGTVKGISILTGAEVSSIPPTAFTDTPGVREITFDPVTRMLWYASTDDVIRSLNVDTLAAGPTIQVTDLVSIKRSRHLVIDAGNRRLLTPLVTGDIQMYNLGDQSSAGQIPATFFTDKPNPGPFRHFDSISDSRTKNVWYARTDGSFDEMNPNTKTETGKVIPIAAQPQGTNSPYRHFAIDPVRNLLIYVGADGSMQSINLASLQPGSVTVPATAFTNTVNGSTRTIAYDPCTDVTAPCIVPGVIGKKLAAAKAALARAHCSTGKVKRAFSKKVKKGRVSGEKPKAGSKRANRAPIDLTVSKGRKK